MKKKKIITAAVLTAALSLAATFTCYADYSEQIDEVKQEQSEQMSELESTQARLDELNSLQGDADAYLNELSKQLTDMVDTLNRLDQAAQEKEAQIARIEAELQQAEQEEAKQYEDMKLRIQYIYEETSNTGALEALFSAESFTDFLNAAENMDQINKFDRDMLEQYDALVRENDAKRTALLEEREQIEQLRAASEEQIIQLQSVYEETYHQILDYEAEAAQSAGHQQELIASIREKEEQIDQLMVQKYAEEAAEAQRIAEEEAARAAEEAARQQEGSGEESEDPAPSSDEGQTVPDNANLTYLGDFTLTAYCPCPKCCGIWSSYPAITASGAVAEQGITVAMGGVDFGTQLMINGQIYTVQDRGTPYGHVDIFFNDHDACIQFGLQTASVYLVN